MEIPKKEGRIFFFSPGRSASVWDMIIIFIYYTIHTCRYIIIKHKTKDKTEENSLISSKKESTAAVCGSPGAKSTVIVFIVSGT